MTQPPAHTTPEPTANVPGPRLRGNPVGVASLIAGVLLVLAIIAEQTVMLFLPVALAELSFPYRSVPYLISLPPPILATIATALGIVGLLLRDRTRVAAIIGTTLGVSHLIVGMAGVLSSALFLSATPW
ncbi:hypothetical protein [Brachybacterium sp. UNK5269]|uniref:hypothetical protein n=1 Tax=Brachybacterium sp. UNK5269 TaxID=3408576 RepID=UPI003BAEA1E2